MFPSTSASEKVNVVWIYLSSRCLTSSAYMRLKERVVEWGSASEPTAISASSFLLHPHLSQTPSRPLLGSSVTVAAMTSPPSSESGSPAASSSTESIGAP